MHRRAFDETKRELLAVESHKALLSDPHTAMLQAKLKLRTPYITPLNILQVQQPPCCCQWSVRHMTCHAIDGQMRHCIWACP
jgi:Phosphoenolpyruvate carboxylase